ncbi:MAG: ABC transporter ATP-binding protein [Limnochordia bacterium]|jgi:ATP-binding cassette subfamily B multidrug efflux pump|nr:ABC transporter ATP-binding protein [Bacillota bacterium]NLH32227.1 ABC transporter ATP-binding protein [Bacillota bacterium]HOB08032.1 ABC transporter ATP-binding protein [Limnochordia bacterium]HPT92495.1 ABC transporter ATP-binding protein [Limnochordia bacterium]HQD71367.1 ABC transporter ATP-binding protein [Limnochordia bacterium]
MIRRGPGPGFARPKIRAKDTVGTLKRLVRYLDFAKRKLILVFVLVLSTALFAIIGPYLVVIAIDHYILPGNLRGLAFLTAGMIALYAVNALFHWLQASLMVELAQTTVGRIRRELFAKIQTLPLKFFDTSERGDLMSRLTNDVDNISQILTSSVTQVFNSLITLVGVLAMMLYLSPLLTLANLAVIPVMLLIVGKVASMSRNFFMQQQTALGELNGFIEETISGQKVVKVFTKEQTMLERFSTLNNNYRRSGIKAQILSGFIPPFMNILNNLNFAVIASLGGWLIVRGLSTIGVIGGFLNYSRQFTGPVMQLSNLFNMIQAAIAGAERVFEVLDQEPEPEDAPDAKAPDRIDGEVQFEDVSFAYEKERPVLHGISLEAKPGQVIALVGPTGAGKTTIINLLTRFYDIDQGRITIDGLDIRQIKRDRLRSLLGVVLQDTYLFSASVKENIRYGRLDATDAEVEQAAKLANAHSFIIRLPNGYDTILSEDGSNLSQGQRQLLAIARAILADPAILILDEATSSVDTRTEQQIQSAMLELMKGRTSFVIAHRLSTIRNADLIVVIDQGRIVEQGKHQELLERKGFYYNLYMSQFSLPLSS